jgi:RimJ/RimL family protein N-acetyltransferase
VGDHPLRLRALELPLGQSSEAMFPDLLRDDVFRLETERLWLRWPCASDAVEITRLASDAEVASATARIPHPYPADAAIAFVLQARRQNSEGSATVFVVAAKRRPSVPLGVIGLDDAGYGRLLLGYWLGKPHWKRGIMTEAASALVGLAFTWTEAAEIAAAVQVGNLASQRILEKCGFRFVRQAFQDAPARPAPMLCNFFALERGDWRDRNAAIAVEPSLGAF